MFALPKYQRKRKELSKRERRANDYLRKADTLKLEIESVEKEIQALYKDTEYDHTREISKLETKKMYMDKDRDFYLLKWERNIN